MSIQSSELRLYKAAQNSNIAAANGGIASYSEIISGVNNNLLPDVSQAERLAGAIHFRKVFYKNLNAANLSLLNARVFVENYTPGDDAAYFHVGNDTNLQSALTGMENLFGCGKLDASIGAGAVSLNILIEQTGSQFFRNGDMIRISDKATIDATGNEEFVTVDQAPGVAGNIVTLHVTSALVNSYLATATRVANCLIAGTVVANVTNVSVTTAGNGDYDNVGSPMAGDNLGTVYDTWAITFTSSTAFNCVGALSGSLGVGSTLVDFTPQNINTVSPYFTLRAAGFNGVWAAGDTLTFITHPAHIPLWVKRIVPAGCAAYAGDRAVLAIDGETA